MPCPVGSHHNILLTNNKSLIIDITNFESMFGTLVLQFLNKIIYKKKCPVSKKKNKKRFKVGLAIRVAVSTYLTNLVKNV
jgi:hypothetical protein